MVTLTPDWTLLERLHEGVLIAGVDGTVRYINAAARRLLGVSRPVHTITDLDEQLVPTGLWQSVIASAPADIEMVTPAGWLRLQSWPNEPQEQSTVQICLQLSQPNHNGAREGARESGRDGGRSSDQLDALIRVSQALNASLHLNSTLTVVLEEAIAHTGAAGGQISLHDGETNRYWPRLQRGFVSATIHFDEQAIASGHSLLLRHTPPLQGQKEQETAPLAATLITPIEFAGRVTGLIHIYFTRPEQATRHAERFLSALANHAAIAIGNALRFDEMTERNALLQRQAQQIEHVVEASRVIHGQVPLDQVYEDLVYAIQDGVGYQVVLLSLAFRQGDYWALQRTTAAGLPLERLRQLQQTRQAWDNVAQLMQPQYRLGSAYHVPQEDAVTLTNLSVQHVDDLYPTRPPGRDADSRQVWRERDIFIIPLYDSHGDPLGLISLDAPLDGLRPDLNTARVLEIFANQAAAAIENVQLFHNLRDFARQLEQQHAVSQAALREPDSHKRLQLIVDGLQATGWGRVSLTLRDEQFQATELVTAGLTHEEHQYLWDNLLPASVWRQRLRDPQFEQHRIGSCYFVPAEDSWGQEEIGVMLPDHTPVRDEHGAWHPNDFLCLPLFDLDHKPIALITLDQPVNGRRPDAHSLQIVELYARFTASVAQNIRLFDQLVVRNEELNTLFAASRAIVGTLEAERVLDAMGEHLLKASDASGYVIYEWQPEAASVVVLQSQMPGNHLALPRPGTTCHLQESQLLAQVMRQGAPSVQPLDEQSAALLTTPAGTNATIALFPINLREELFGFVALVGTPQFQLDESQTKLLEAVINQAGTALETARLFEDTFERERFYAALGRVSLAINATLDLPTVLNLICRESLAIFKVDTVYTWRREEDALHGIAARGVAADAFFGLRTPAGDHHNFSAAIIEQGVPLVYNQVQTNPQWQLQLPQQESIQAVMGIPLKTEQETIGALIFVDRQNPQRFTSRDIDQASTFGVQMAIAIQNAQLVTELRELNEQLDERVERRTRELAEESERVKILLRISSELTASLDKDRVLNQALLLVNEAVHGTQGNILLIQPDTQNLVFYAAFDEERPRPPSGMVSSISSQDGLAGWVIRRREAAIVADTKSDPRWVARPGTSSRHRSVLAVPLINGEEIIGIMMLFHPEPNAFTENHLALVTAAGIQVANAIYNANLYDLIRDQAERLGVMMRNAQVEVAKTHSILESIADGVLVAQANGEIVLVNQPTTAILGMTREQLVGKTVYDLQGLYGSSGDSWIDTIEYWANNSDKIQARTSRVNQLAIENQVVSVHISPVFANRQYFGTVSIFRDITKEVEVDRMKNEFVSTVSHELRTPMTSIKGYADLMLIGAAGAMNPIQDRYLRVIQKNADRLKLLVDDLLDISRIETGKTQLQHLPLDIPQVIHSVVHEHVPGRLQSLEKELHVRPNIAPNMPLALGDQEKVTRILTNLVDNALNYTPAGGTVTVHAYADDNNIYIGVADTGIGIAKEHQAKIFERFYRAESETVQLVSGTGLGLAIVKSLVEMHGGTINVESEPGKGSTFTFSIPQVKDEEQRY